jgi:two-component system, LuxR family, sensor kinase FixL
MRFGTGEVVYSESYYRLLGVAPEERAATLEFWRARVHPADLDAVRSAFGDYAAGRSQTFEQEYRMRHADGRWLWLLDRSRTVARDAQGLPLRVIGFAVDITKRRTAEQALRESEERFRLATSAVNGVMYESDLLTGRSVLHGIERLLGLHDDEVPDTIERWLAMVHPEDRDRVRGTILQRRSRGRPYDDLYYRVVRPDGDVMHVWARGSYIRDENGRAVRAVGLIEDVTARVQAEEALRRSETVLQTIMAASATNLALYDRDHRCVFANYALHGAPVEEIIGKRIYEYIPPQYHEQVRTAFESVIATGQGADTENEMLIEGHTVPRLYETRLRPVTVEGEIVGLVTNISDVTEMRAQRENLYLQGRIIATIREGVVLLDREGHVLLANPAMHSLFGYPPNGLVGREFRELAAQPGATFDRLLKRVLQDLDAGEAPQAEFEGRRVDGERLVATCIFAAINIRGERRIVAVLSDITERKRLEREVLQVATREQQRIGSDLHDGLGQQLTGIALLLKGLVPRLTRARPAELRGDVEQIVSLVNDAIDSTRSLARGLSPVPAADDGLSLALEALATQIFERHDVEVVIDNGLPEDQGFDDNTATHLYRIVQEALGNALRHGQPKRVTVQLRDDGGQIELAVTDDGPGFDRRAVQAGLGLKIMRFRAQMVGGDLTVESTPGAGTTIRCHCPSPRAA